MNIKQIIDETKSEIKKVSWPTKQRVGQATGIVLVIVLVMSFLTSVFDMSFGGIMNIFINR